MSGGYGRAGPVFTGPARSVDAAHEPAYRPAAGSREGGRGMAMSDSGWAEWRRFRAAMLAVVGAFTAAEGLVMLYGGDAIGVQRDRMMLAGPRVWGEVSVALGGLLLMLGVWLWIVTVRVRLA